MPLHFKREPDPTAVVKVAEVLREYRDTERLAAFIGQVEASVLARPPHSTAVSIHLHTASIGGRCACLLAGSGDFLVCPMAFLTVLSWVRLLPSKARALRRGSGWQRVQRHRHAT